MKAALLTVLALAAGGLVTYAALAQQETAPETAEATTVEILGQEADAETLRLGEEIYAENCASCHGADLEGQPDWKRRLENGRMPAPPHDASGHTWHHSDQDLFVITREGVDAVVPGYESDMPAFGSILSDDEIQAVLAFIKSTWPEREREFQAEVTRNAAEEDGS